MCFTHVVKLPCEIHDESSSETGSATIEFHFGEIEENYVRVRLRVVGYWPPIETSRSFFGFDIHSFMLELKRIHADLAGTVRLRDFDGENVLSFTVIDAGRGRIAVGGQFFHALFNTKVTTEDRYLGPLTLGYSSGIRIAFEGLVVEQSYLPQFIRDLGQFLSDTGLSVRNPWDS